jgi:hypothetical protein
MARIDMAVANPNIRVAEKTLVAIETAIAADQGSAFRGWLGKVIPHIDDAYRTGEDGFRTHMGASLIGGKCARAVWYGFNWARKPKFSGQTLRLFNRGHLEEARFIACLLTIGCRVVQQDENGKQFRISEMGGHYGGSGDGLALGVPDLPPTTWALCEFKTHNNKSFEELAGKNFKKYIAHLFDSSKPYHPFDGQGVRAAKPEHYIQMQQYMRKMGLAAALYVAVNKDNDCLYAEIVLLDEATADEFLGRAHKLVPMRQAPAKMSETPGNFECKWCDFYRICHYNETPARNCRTCAYSRPDTETGKWMCDNKDRQIELLFPATNPDGEDFSLTKERQLKGCNRYELSPAFKG